MGQQLFGAKLGLLLTAEETIREPFQFVDDPGCLMLAFLTTNLADDLARLAEAGGHARRTTLHLKVNKRALKVGFATGPSGEKVELIQPMRL